MTGPVAQSRSSRQCAFRRITPLVTFLLARRKEIYLVETIEIRDFDSATPAPRETLARLHAELLPNSPMHLLGHRFMRDFYYALLPANDLIKVSIAFVGGEPAGFIASTDKPNEFISVALRRWWPRLAWTLCTQILVRPTCVFAGWEAWRIMSARKREPSPVMAAGEILSLGVLPQFRDHRFVQQTHVRLGNELTKRALQKFSEAGINSVFAIVDADNLPAHLMYGHLGWRLTRKVVPGWRIPSVEFTHTNSTVDCRKTDKEAAELGNVD